MKKKTAIVSGFFCVMSTLVCLGGCHSRVNAPETTTEKQDVFQSGEFSDNVNEIAKAQKIVVVPIKDESGAVSEDTENEVVITDKDEVRKFADKLTDNITGWKVYILCSGDFESRTETRGPEVCESVRNDCL